MESSTSVIIQGGFTIFLALKNRPPTYGRGSSNKSVPTKWPLITIHCQSARYPAKNGPNSLLVNVEIPIFIAKD